MADKIEAKASGGGDVAAAVTEVVKDAYSESKRIIFGGDNYAEEWHAEAEQRGLKNLRTTAEALPEVISEQTVGTFDKYDVLSERELESRYEVWVEQYTIRANIEAETAATIARTQLLPAALRHVALCEAAGLGDLATEARTMTEEFAAAIRALEAANVYPDGVEGLQLAEYARDSQLTALAAVREVADRLEKIVADDLWPLPKYSEVLFIK
jgi:glutamine synthetase